MVSHYTEDAFLAFSVCCQISLAATFRYPRGRHLGLRSLKYSGFISRPD